MRFLIYLRVSTDDQNERYQLDYCLEEIKRRGGGEHLIFNDPDVSSRVPMEHRQGLQDMLRSIKNGDTVITFKLDRLSRDILEMVTIYRKIESKQAKVISLSEPNIESWMIGIFGSLAQKERQNISERTKAALRAKKIRGERVGRIPYGQCLKNGILKIDKYESEVLKIMYNMRESDNLSFREIASRLNRLGYTNRNQSPWTHGATSRVYKNYLIIKDNKAITDNYALC